MWWRKPDLVLFMRVKHSLTCELFVSSLLQKVDCARAATRPEPRLRAFIVLWLWWFGCGCAVGHTFERMACKECSRILRRLGPRQFS